LKILFPPKYLCTCHYSDGSGDTFSFSYHGEKKKKKKGISKNPLQTQRENMLTCPSHTLKKIKPSFHEHWEHDFKREIMSKLGYFATVQRFQKPERELDLCNENPTKSCLESHPSFKVPM
jgi:hypothetical protein